MLCDTGHVTAKTNSAPPQKWSEQAWLCRLKHPQTGSCVFVGTQRLKGSDSNKVCHTCAHVHIQTVASDTVGVMHS